MFNGCTCQVAGPVTECGDAWLCSSCFAKSDIKDYGCGDALSANFNHQRGPGHRGLSPQASAPVRSLRLAARYGRKPVPVRVRRVQAQERQL